MPQRLDAEPRRRGTLIVPFAAQPRAESHNEELESEVQGRQFSASALRTLE